MGDNMDKVSNLRSNAIYDENGETLADVIINIYKKILLPKNDKTVDFHQKYSTIDSGKAVVYKYE